MTNTDLLNTVQRFLIDFANEKGIRLDTQFSSVEKFKEFVIGLTFKTLCENGVSTSVAYDAVFGEGSYNKLYEDIRLSASARQSKI
jgi:hypothetical protein